MIRNRNLLLDVPDKCRKKREMLLDAVEYAIKSVHPDTVIPENLRMERDSLAVAGKNFHLKGRLALFGMGKAGYEMAKAVNSILGDRVDFGFVNSVKEANIGNIRVMKASHPFPDENTLKNTEKILSYAGELNEEDTALVLISGGGSSMFCFPEDGVSLEDIREISGEIMRKGGDIRELNAVRRSLSKVKGGGFAAVLRPAKIISLIISDVTDNDLSSIASGPTVKSGDVSSESERILKKYGIWGRLGEDVRNAVKKRKKADDADLNLIIADNDRAVRHASAFLTMAGVDHLISRRFTGNVGELGRILAKARLPMVIGGEPITEVKGTGIGGRVQETVLRAINSGFDGFAVSIGTDGIDGNSPYAGALSDLCVLDKMAEMGLEPEEFLRNSDSSRFFEKIGSVVETGYTGTNVADLVIAFPRKTI